jgi:adenylate cyclase
MSAKINNNTHAGAGGHPGLPEEAVKQELARVLASPEFQRSPSLRDFLLFIVEKTLAGQSHEIKGYTVATQVLGKDANFDADKDPIVRILAGRLRRALERYYLLQGRQDPVRIDVPVGAYVPSFQPAFQAKPEIPPTPAGPGDSALSMPSGPSLAVMPLLNLTGNRGQEYFADGLAEELTSELARFQDLRVIAFQSTLRYKANQPDARVVGRDLGVRFLVQGSVRKAARSIKIGILLIDTLSGRQIWGEQYRREQRANTLIALQEEIARRVAVKVGSEYGIIPQTLSRESRRKPPDSLETYEAFLRFYHHVTVMTPQTFAEALPALEQAVEEDRESGLAWSLLAFLYGQSYSLQLSPMESPLEKALGAAQKGAALEPDNQTTRAALAHVHFFRNEREAFMAEAETALSLNPNAAAMIGFLGWLLALYGEWERGLAILKKGMDLNPFFPGWFHMAPYFNFYRLGMYREALLEAQAFQMPQFFWDALLRAAALGQLEREQEGAQALEELFHNFPNFPSAAPFLISCYVKLPSLVEALLDGLRLAGLNI